MIQRGLWFASILKKKNIIICNKHTHTHIFDIRVLPFVWPISFHLLQKNSTFLQWHYLLKLDIFGGRYTSFIYHENPQPSCLGVINFFGGAYNLHSFEFWCIFTYNERLIFMVNFELVGKYTSPMDPMGVYIRGDINVALGSSFLEVMSFHTRWANTLPLLMTL